MRILDETIYDGSGRCIYAVGTSSESKPTDHVISGSIYFEVDTSKAFMYNETSHTWVEAKGTVDEAAIEAAVTEWLEAHPEATTTVTDGSITEPKLTSALLTKINNSASGVSQLSDEIVDVKSAFDGVTELSKNLLPSESKTTTVFNVDRLYDDGTLTSSGTATSAGGRLYPITSNFVLPAGTYTISKNIISGSKYALYLVNANDTSDYETFLANDNEFSFTLSEQKTVFLAGGYSNGADYTFKYNIQLEKGNSATPFTKPSYKTAIDKIARERLQNELTHIKVMSYNVGSYNFGTSKNFTPEEQADITRIYRKFYNDQGCDILGLQEAKTNFSSGNPVNPQIYTPLYPYMIDSINTAALKSRFKFIESGTFDISTDTSDNRHCAYAICEIAGREVYILDTHFSPLSAELRQDNYAEVLAILAQHEYFICFGDFNGGSDPTEYNAFTNAGYNIANCGYLGNLNTMGSQIGTDTPRPNDNIVTSGNIIISGVSVLSDLYNTLKSDHLPIVADLIFNA